MFEGLDFLDRRYLSVVSQAIQDSRLSFHIQGIHSADNRNDVLYGECLARLSDVNGNLYEANEFVPALEMLGASATLDRCMVSLVLDKLVDNPTMVLGCNISTDTLANDEAWGGIINDIEARKHIAPRFIMEIIETRPLGVLSTLNARLSHF